jgi:RNA polymerase-interacting CarD/CdnL/TRCF family regulator
MNYQIGDQVVHWLYGMGKITGIEEKSLSGQTCSYYVVAIDRLTVWVPVLETGQSCLRYPTPSSDFKLLLNRLLGPGAQLPTHQYERQTELARRMQRRTLGEVCQIICDLNSLARRQKLNRNDTVVFKRAKEFLLAEWKLSLGATYSEAQHELDVLLTEQPTPSPAA